MCGINQNMNVKILAAKPKIGNLFVEYGYVPDVTIENVNEALRVEGSDFEQRLNNILENVNMVNNTGREQGQQSDNGMLPTVNETQNNKGEVALNWFNTIGGFGTGLLSGISGIKNGAPPVNNYYTTPPATSNNSTNIIIIVLVGIALLGGVFYMSNNN